MRVLVCGGRDFSDPELLGSQLSRLHREHPIRVLIEGGARGADTFARKWAKVRGISVLTYPADWDRHGRAAGPIRNKEMLDYGHPDLVLAFAGGRGTADMVRQAKAAGVRVIEVT